MIALQGGIYTKHELEPNWVQRLLFVDVISFYTMYIYFQLYYPHITFNKNSVVMQVRAGDDIQGRYKIRRLKVRSS
jgi:hypothetical protein